MLLPKDHQAKIYQLHEFRSYPTTINIYGGHNIIAPNARNAKQHSHHGNKTHKKS